MIAFTKYNYGFKTYFEIMFSEANFSLNEQKNLTMSIILMILTLFFSDLNGNITLQEVLESISLLKEIKRQE
jgi:hypothetical protein